MARIRIPLQAWRSHAPSSMEHPQSAAARLADVVRRARWCATSAVVFALSRAPLGKRAVGDRTLGKKSFSRQTADLCARRVLRVRLCRKRAGGRPMVEPTIGGTLFPQGALEDGRRGKRRVGFALFAGLQKIRPG